MPELSTNQVWVVIIVGGILVLTLAIFMFKFLKAGGKFKAGKIEAVFISDKEKENNCLYKFLMKKLEDIRQDKYSRFLKLLKSKGIEQAYLVSHEDARFYWQCLGNIVFSGNGINSFKSILEKELILNSYSRTKRVGDFDKYILGVVEECMNAASKYLSNNYNSEMSFGKDKRLRTVSCEELFLKNKVEESQKNLTNDIIEIFKEAIDFNNKEC